MYVCTCTCAPTYDQYPPIHVHMYAYISSQLSGTMMVLHVKPLNMPLDDILKKQGSKKCGDRI